MLSEWHKPVIVEGRVLNGRGSRLDGMQYSFIPARAVDDLELNGLELRLLAHHGRSNAKHGFCETSQTELARRFGVHRQSVCRSLAKLCNLGYLEKLSQKDRRESYCAYRIAGVKPTGDTPQRGSETYTSTPRHLQATGVSPHTTPNRDTDLTDLSDQKDRQSTSQSFDEFWSAYPRKIGRKEAHSVYASIVESGQASPDEINAGARRLAVASRGKDLEFIKHPANWLRGDHWKDGALSLGGPPDIAQGLIVTEKNHPDAFNAWLEHERLAMVERRPSRYSSMRQHRFIGGVPSLFPPAREVAC